MMARKVENKNMEMTTRKAFSNTYRENNVPSSNLPQRLTPQQLDERRAKGLCFVTASILRDISAVRRNYSTYIVKRKNQNKRKYLKKRLL